MPDTNRRPAAAAADAPEAVVTRFLQAMDGQDPEAVRELLHPELVYTNVSLPSLRGGERVAGLFERVMRYGVRVDIQTHHIAATGNVVLTERTDMLKLGPLRVPFWVCGTFEVREGRITVWRDYFDWMDITRAALRGALGAILPPFRPGDLHEERR